MAGTFDITGMSYTRGYDQFHPCNVERLNYLRLSLLAGSKLVYFVPG